MKNTIFVKLILVAAVIGGCIYASNAQNKKNQAAKLDPFGNPVENTDKKANNNNANATSSNPFEAPPSNNNNIANKNIQTQRDTVPYVTVQSTGENPLTDVESPSLRNDYAVDAQYIRDQIPLALDPIREDDAVYTQRLWSVIDTREKMNLPFRNPRNEDNGSQLFFAILYRAVSEGGVTAFEDDKFKRPISKERFLKDYAGGYDTVPFRGDLDNPDKITRYEIRANEFPVDSVYKFMVKEDYIFDKEASRLVRRIIGIAPMMPPMVKGKIIEGIGNEAYPKFWLYYNDLRPILAKYRVFNAKNYAANISWDDLFQAHMYSSYIVKTSKDNVMDLALKDYINDPLFRLLEGEKIKKAIFDYEQNQWQY